MTGTELGKLAYSGAEATGQVCARLESADLRVYRSFDLQSATCPSSGCTCPDHGTESCDCQLVVLLVYQGTGSPATVILHGHCGQTWVMLVETPNRELRQLVTAALAPAFFASIGI